MSKKKTEFQPSSMGCGSECKIEKYMKKHKDEICCDQARQCCFFCYEEGCPVKEKFRKLIQKYGDLNEEAGSLGDTDLDPQDRIDE